jgi:hypothetical protein
MRTPSSGSRRTPSRGASSSSGSRRHFYSQS